MNKLSKHLECLQQNIMNKKIIVGLMILLALAVVFMVVTYIRTRRDGKKVKTKGGM